MKAGRNGVGLPGWPDQQRVWAQWQNNKATGWVLERKELNYKVSKAVKSCSLYIFRERLPCVHLRFCTHCNQTGSLSAKNIMLTFLMHEPFGIIHEIKLKCGGHGIWVEMKPPQGPWGSPTLRLLNSHLLNPNHHTKTRDTQLKWTLACCCWLSRSRWAAAETPQLHLWSVDNKVIQICGITCKKHHTCTNYLIMKQQHWRILAII